MWERLWGLVWSLSRAVGPVDHMVPQPLGPPLPPLLLLLLLLLQLLVLHLLSLFLG